MPIRGSGKASFREKSLWTPNLRIVCFVQGNSFVADQQRLCICRCLPPNGTRRHQIEMKQHQQTHTHNGNGTKYPFEMEIRIGALRMYCDCLALDAEDTRTGDDDEPPTIWIVLENWWSGELFRIISTDDIFVVEYNYMCIKWIE